MRRRSYEFFEVRSNIGKEGEDTHFRGEEEGARAKLRTMSATVDLNKGNIYLVRCQVLEAWKADKS